MIRKLCFTLLRTDFIKTCRRRRRRRRHRHRRHHRHHVKKSISFECLKTEP